MIRKFYEGKTVFLTGTTGFLAKVILEKFLRSAPEIKRIYILIRAKGGKTLADRFKSEILDTELFRRLKKEVNNWEEHVNKIVIPIRGDLVITSNPY